MVATAGTFSSRRDRAFLWGVLASILLHAVLFVPGIRDVFQDAVNLQNIDRAAATPPDIPMEFTIVSPPENPTPSEEESEFRSTVSSQASDTDPRDTGSNVPRSEGRMPLPETPGDRKSVV